MGVRFAPSCRMRRIQDALLGAGSLGLLVALLTAIDHDVRRFVTNVLGGDASELVRVTEPVNRAARIAIQTVNDYRTDDAPLFAFAVVAVVLFSFLFKA